MSIFAKDLVGNSDDIVLKEYNLVYNPVSPHEVCLHEKDHGMYPRKIFVRGLYLWREYVNEAMDDVLKFGGGIEKFIEEKDFLLYIKNSPLISKLEFKGETWYEKRYLWNVFEAYNEHVLERHMAVRYKKHHKRLV